MVSDAHCWCTNFAVRSESYTGLVTELSRVGDRVRRLGDAVVWLVELHRVGARIAVKDLRRVGERIALGLVKELVLSAVR